MAKVYYLSLEEVLAIHFDQVVRYGGSHGVRVLPLLESALQRPQSSFMGEDLYPTVFNKAAALIHSLLMNHPFVDANKRTAMSSGVAFLHFNGFDLNVSDKEFVQAALNIESKKWDLEEIAKWLKDNSIKSR